MSSSAQYTPLGDSSENTPLLDDHDGEPRQPHQVPPPGGDGENDEFPSPKLTPRAYKVLFSLLVTQLILSPVAIGLSIAVIVILRYAEKHHDMRDWFMNEFCTASLVIAGIFGMVHAILNIIRLRRNGLVKGPSWRILNLLCGACFVFMAVSLQPKYFPSWGFFCHEWDDNGYYDGSHSECQSWSRTYIHVIWALLACICLNAIVSIIFLLYAFSVARSRPPFWPGAKLMKPGHFAVHVDVRWGNDSRDIRWGQVEHTEPQQQDGQQPEQEGLAAQSESVPARQP